MKAVKTIDELHCVELFILNELNSFCKQNQLNFYLIDGSLLGAIRHKGFIPWDDDIDVCMTRSDYNKLKEISNCNIGDKCQLIDPETNLEFNGVVPLLVYKNSDVISKQFRTNESLKISVSIFVYDGAPSNRISRFFYYNKMFLLRAKHALCRADFHHVNSRKAKFFGPILKPFFSTKHVLKYKNKILKLQKKYTYENSEFVATNADANPLGGYFKKEDFEKSIDIEFEGLTLKTYSCYDMALTRNYGDYMQLPPPDKRKPKHGFDVKIEESFEFN